MTTPDLINGMFELGGGILISLSILKLYKDKEVKGVHIAPVCFFMAWGYWNLFFYPHLHQWLSFIGGLSTVTANTVWVGQMIYYARRNRGRRKLLFVAHDCKAAGCTVGGLPVD